MYTIVEGGSFELKWFVFWDVWGEDLVLAQFTCISDAVRFVLACYGGIEQP